MNWYSIHKSAMALPIMPERNVSSGYYDIDERMREDTAKEEAIKNPDIKYLGSGFCGIACDIGGGKAVKYTVYESEANMAKFLMENEGQYPTVKVYDVQLIQDKPRIWAIVMEKVQEISNEEVARNRTAFKNLIMDMERRLEPIGLQWDVKQANMGINKEGKVVARCLIWLVDGNTYFDRIYSINLEVEIRMHGYLTKKKFIQISNKNSIKPSSIPSLNIKLDAHDFKYYPYMDTLCFLTSRGVLNNNGMGDSLQATHGFRRDPITCAYSGRPVYDDVETVIIVAGNYTNHRVIKTFAVYSEFYKGYLIKNSACQEETTKDWYLRSDCRCSHDGKYYLANNPLLKKTEDDEYFIEGDPNILEINGKYYNKDSYRFSMEVNEPNITTTSLQISDMLDAIYRRIR